MRMLRSLKQRSEKIDFRFSDFSEKQLKVLLWWCKASPVRDRLSIIADGSIRSGKTLSMGLSFFVWAMLGFDKSAVKPLAHFGVTSWTRSNGC